MTLTINGNPYQLKTGSFLPELLSEMKLAGKPVVIELNRKALTPEQHAKTALQEGDVLEIVILAAGG